LVTEIPYNVTVDLETDFGGRIRDTTAIKYSLPRILELFHDNNIKALFFVSTELLDEFKELVPLLKINKHEVGSHGHFHTKLPKWRADEDKRLSEEKLSTYFFLSQKYRYRAPKFYNVTDDPYSNPKNHVGLLKMLWLNQKLKRDSIFYFHPFDIMVTDTPAPNLFCKFWYSRPEEAWKLLKEICESSFSESASSLRISRK